MKKIPTLLQGEVCHLTTIDSFLKINETGFILRRLDDSNVSHKKNGQNSKNSQQGYVQILGGISVFDLRNFDLNVYDQYIESTWDVFLVNYIVLYLFIR